MTLTSLQYMRLFGIGIRPRVPRTVNFLFYCHFSYSLNMTRVHPGVADGSFEIPTSMQAIRYNKPQDFSLVTVPVPTPGPSEILVKDIVERNSTGQL